MREYREEDIPGIVELVRARAKAYGTDLLGADQVRRRMQGPEGAEGRPAIVVTGPRIGGVAEGGLLGAGSVDIEGSEESGEYSYVLRFWGHPAAIEAGVETAIAERLLERIREKEAGSDASGVSDVRVYASYREGMAGRKELYERLGMTFARQFLRMERSLDEPIDEPAKVGGVTIRPYRRPEDNVGACAAYNDSFSDHWDHHEEPQELWDTTIAEPSRRPDLSWLAEVDGEPGKFGGFCLCVIHEDSNRERGVREGWIELLGTIREWRGKGLGRSLLLHGLRSLKSDGLDTALLMVDSESPTGANLLYEKVGFRVKVREIVCSMPLEKVLESE
jgi:mycothiol synthase